MSATTDAEVSAMTEPPRTAPPARRRPRRDPSPATGRALPGAEFDSFYTDEWSTMVALGWSLTGSWAIAEELAQDAFADAYRRWDEVAVLDRPGAWVRRAVINRSASHHRHRGVEERGRRRLQTGTMNRERQMVDTTGDDATDRVSDPAFWVAVRSLPERQLACVALHYLEDRPVAEIAEVLDCRPATVKVHLHRGRRALAKRLSALQPSPGSTADISLRPDPATNDLREEQR